MKITVIDLPSSIKKIDDIFILVSSSMPCKELTAVELYFLRMALI